MDQKKKKIEEQYTFLEVKNSIISLKIVNDTAERGMKWILYELFILKRLPCLTLPTILYKNIANFVLFTKYSVSLYMTFYVFFIIFIRFIIDPLWNTVEWSRNHQPLLTVVNQKEYDIYFWSILHLLEKLIVYRMRTGPVLEHLGLDSLRGRYTNKYL